MTGKSKRSKDKLHYFNCILFPQGLSILEVEEIVNII